ncbi:MAG TPA: hypothetical protein VMA35_13455 [Candidatus Sulfopaludibacter sp.]|nr:hypothetical protein [Candidatus Sulfopaludibacter sp.]
MTRPQKRCAGGTLPHQRLHITASAYINDAEDGLLHDYDFRLNRWRHTSQHRNTSIVAPARTTPTRT